MADVISFLLAIFHEPGDEAARLVFADWLEEQGDWRSEFLRLDHDLKMMDEKDERFSETRERWSALRAKLSASWLAILGRAPLENCSLRFKFQCPQRWEQLKPTKAASVRACDSCHKFVHYCHTIEEGREHARQGRCVAIDAKVLRSPGDLSERPSDVEVTVGVVVDEVTPSEQAERDDRALQLEAALARLPDQQREAVMLKHIHGWSLEEISTYLGVSPKAVAPLLRRGLKKLNILLPTAE